MFTRLFSWLLNRAFAMTPVMDMRFLRDPPRHLSSFELAVCVEKYYSAASRTPDDPNWWDSPAWQSYRIGTTQLQELGDYNLKDGFEAAGLPTPSGFWNSLCLPPSAFLQDDPESRAKIEWSFAARETWALFHSDIHHKLSASMGRKRLQALPQSSWDHWAEMGVRAEKYLKEHGYGMAWRREAEGREQ